MEIGNLNKRITFQSKTSVADGMGGFTETYADSVTVFAAIWPVAAAEVVQANSTNMLISHKIRIRHRAINPAWRIKYGTRYFSILGYVNVKEKNEWIDLTCKEQAS